MGFVSFVINGALNYLKEFGPFGCFVDCVDLLAAVQRNGEIALEFLQLPFLIGRQLYMPLLSRDRRAVPYAGDVEPDRWRQQRSRALVTVPPWCPLELGNLHHGFHAEVAEGLVVSIIYKFGQTVSVCRCVWRRRAGEEP